MLYATTLSLLALAFFSLASGTPSVASVYDCTKAKGVPIVKPGDSSFAELAEPFNLRLRYTPKVIVLPTTAQHISDAIICAGEEDGKIKIQARGGGHSYASFSSGGQDGSMIINLQNFQDIKLDKETNLVRVGGGVRLGNLAQGIYDQGKRALPHGTCPGVGIGGHATHGGYGYTSRTWGLALDTIVGLDVVLPNGTITYITDKQHPDIYWALRGASESFGVVYNFYMKTNPAPQKITYFQFHWNEILGSRQDFIDTFRHIQDFATNSSVIDERITFGLYIDGSTYRLTGSTFGPLDEFNEKIKPELFRTIKAPSSSTVESVDWIPFLISLSDQDSLAEPLTGYDKHDTFFAKSITVPESDGLSDAALGAFHDHINNDQNPESWYTIINLYGGPKSAVNAKTKEFASYAERNSLWVFQNYGVQTSSMPFIQKINDVILQAQPQTRFGAYINYVDPTLDAKTAHELYYGQETYEKLERIKKVVDPKMLFWNPQAIGA
ncbi:FAD-binding domain-containing protein [Delitschia confertaspora ATCC 74209]|uniref:FAD-binding domain-containing protein n=1 Tax=Delitschia confertaspora ATCC 74209 TaxID=1513339 RepID=A0A9P4N210_9PLEO|nr:FAD-binding domain-containing protein [Delitschia confertaspora ATCC 74209]